MVEMKRYILPGLILAVAACGKAPEPAVSTEAAPAAEATMPEKTAAESRLAEVVAAQPAEVQARYAYRHPYETLSFFGIEPGMTVVEGLPGGGWYSKILIQYLGPDGHLIGVDYAQDMFPLFGFFSEEMLLQKETWVEDWTAGANAWYGDDGAKVSAFVFGSMPSEMAGTADAALMIRAMHNLARFESDGAYLSKAVADLYNVLKPGGVLGVVQHMSPDDHPDESADGSRGYLKRDFVMKTLEAAGFRYEGYAAINENSRDVPGADDVVWRLPPSLATSREDPELQEKMKAIGESNRMTLKFIKPAM
ncbi:MAG: class I SAM-dependent methyltransferase [Gammaproteobacteria bacterium]|nr:class I SAM-dependent methyltransferase [Gammaproteobacteria bacterium]